MRSKVGELGTAAEQFHPVDRQMRQVLHAPLERGQPNEHRVAQSLAGHLKASWAPTDKERNERGEDFDLIFPDGRRQIVQATTAVPNEAVWRALGTTGEADFSKSFDDLVSEIRAAIKAKRHLGKDTWLALDAYLTPTVARREIAALYLETYENPCTEFGLSAVWLVGPVPDACFDLCQVSSAIALK